jgi:hypothetical protein
MAAGRGKVANLFGKVATGGGHHRFHKFLCTND